MIFSSDVPGYILVLSSLLIYLLPEINQVIAQETQVHSTSIYNAEEIIALKEFKRLINSSLELDYMKRDAYLIRWLRINNLDVNTTDLKFRQALKWRHDNAIDHILEEAASKDVSKYTNYFIDGVDNDGNPVLTVDWSHLDMRRFVIAGRTKEILRFFIRMWETAEIKIQESQNTSGRQDISQIVAIFDINGYNLRQHACLSCFTVYLEYQRHITNFYSGIIKNIYLINAPRSFARLSEYLKPATPLRTRNVFGIYSIDRNEWRPVLLKHIKPDQLRQQFGGTKVSK